jgi:hypothetical protein
VSGAGPSEWLGALEAAFGEVARTALGQGGATVAAHAAAPPPGCQGAYLGLLSPQCSVQIGIASDEGGCQALAKGLLGMGAGDAALDPAEMADAFCEIVNIVAGGFKARLRDRVPSMQLGLPVFFRGPVQPTGHTAVEVAEVRLDGFAAALLLVYPRAHAEG